MLAGRNSKAEARQNSQPYIKKDGSIIPCAILASHTATTTLQHDITLWISKNRWVTRGGACFWCCCSIVWLTQSQGYREWEKGEREWKFISWNGIRCAYINCSCSAASRSTCIPAVESGTTGSSREPGRKREQKRIERKGACNRRVLSFLPFCEYFFPLFERKSRTLFVFHHIFLLSFVQ